MSGRFLALLTLIGFEFFLFKDEVCVWFCFSDDDLNSVFFWLFVFGFDRFCFLFVCVIFVVVAKLCSIEFSRVRADRAFLHKQE